MTDKMREEFEVYAERICLGRVSRMDDGLYVNPVVEMMWQAWKASRAALCVELPSKINDQSDKWSNGYDFGIDDAQDALEDAGVRYK